jgi:hypothetical protein
VIRPGWLPVHMRQKPLPFILLEARLLVLGLCLMLFQDPGISPLAADLTGAAAIGLPPSGRARPAEMVKRCGAETTVAGWREELVCSRCGSRKVDMVAPEPNRDIDQDKAQPANNGDCRV